MNENHRMPTITRFVLDDNEDGFLQAIETVCRWVESEMDPNGVVKRNYGTMGHPGVPMAVAKLRDSLWQEPIPRANGTARVVRYDPSAPIPGTITVLSTDRVLNDRSERDRMAAELVRLEHELSASGLPRRLEAVMAVNASLREELEDLRKAARSCRGDLEGLRLEDLAEQNWWNTANRREIRRARREMRHLLRSH